MTRSTPVPTADHRTAVVALGAIGMGLGLMADAHGTPPGWLASLCGSADRDLWSMVRLHWVLLPWMHVGMWVGGFAAVPLLRAIRLAGRRQCFGPLARNVAGWAWMTVGMSSGALVSEYLVLQSGARSAFPIVAGMVSGMVWGMAASVALDRLYLRVRATIALSNFNRRGARAL